MKTFVHLEAYAPTLLIELPYATEQNFTGEKVYPIHEAFLQEEVAESLVRAQNAFQKKGFLLKILDAYRPFSIQEKFWKICPDDRFIAKPVREGQKLISGSHHNRGAAVDVTLTDLHGKEVSMPSGFDEFTERAMRTYDKGPKEALKNRDILMQVMEENDFKGIEMEWWHFNHIHAANYPLCDFSLEELLKNQG